MKDLFLEIVPHFTGRTMTSDRAATWADHINSLGLSVWAETFWQQCQREGLKGTSRAKFKDMDPWMIVKIHEPIRCGNRVVYEQGDFLEFHRNNRVILFARNQRWLTCKKAVQYLEDFADPDHIVC